MGSFFTQAPSTQEAKACLNAAITEVANHQRSIAKPLLERKIKTPATERALKIAKTFPQPKGKNNFTDAYSSAYALSMTFSISTAKATEISDLRLQIGETNNALIAPRIHPVSLVSPIYAPEVSVNKRPLLTLGLCLALVVLLGICLRGRSSW